MTKDTYSEEIIAKVEKHPSVRHAQNFLLRDHPDLVIFISTRLSKADIIEKILGASACVSTAKSGEVSARADQFYKLVERCAEKREVESVHLFKAYGYLFPLVQGERFYGFASIFGLSKKLTHSAVFFLSSAFNVVIRDIQKDIELTKLFETIRPRAVALSTIHTVHRLINSTLDLDELLPRVARLCMQVVRANRCSIKLLDSATNTLIPKTTIDLRVDEVKPKKLKVGVGIPGKAVQQNKIIRGKHHLALPLYDDNIIGVITIYDKIDRKPFTYFDQEIMTTLAEQAVVAIKNAQLYRRQEEITIGSIRALSELLNSHIDEAYRPKESMRIIVEAICQVMNLEYEHSKTIKYAAMLHNSDKALVPDAILNKKKRLSKKEVIIIKEQPKRSVDIVKHLEHLGPVSKVILHKHENFDGTGYPDGLKGKEIPLGSRIMLLIDAFLAMLVQRPYRTKKSFEEALDEIVGRSGSQFDPDIVEYFMRVIRKPIVLKSLLKEGFLSEGEVKTKSKQSKEKKN